MGSGRRDSSVPGHSMNGRSTMHDDPGVTLDELNERLEAVWRPEMSLEELAASSRSGELEPEARLRLIAFDRRRSAECGVGRPEEEYERFRGDGDAAAEPEV